MYQRSFLAVLLTSLLHTMAHADEALTLLFQDGLWRGGIEAGSSGSDFAGCWASTTFKDATTFTMAERSDGSWHLRLTNPGWRLPSSRLYAVAAQVDFYPKRHVMAKAMSPTRLEIADLERMSLLELMENGHTIDLVSEGFAEKYSLEGSAKAIERIRDCFANQPAGGGNLQFIGRDKRAIPANDR